MDLIIIADLVDFTFMKATADEVELCSRRKRRCSQCNHWLTGDVYKHDAGKMYDGTYILCSSCYSSLPDKIRHWLHPQHPLTLQTKRIKNTFQWRSSDYSNVYCFVCDGCLYVSFGRFYVCEECKEFKFCVECASSTASRMPLEWESKEPFYHYTHFHQLTRFRYKPRLDYRESPQCWICKLPLWGICYGCTHCTYFIHEFCVDSPQKISHPIHPSHPLIRFCYTSETFIDKDFTCKGCREWIFPCTDIYYCLECEGFQLHLRCADSLFRTLQLESHPHGLLYTGMPSYGRKTDNSRCGICHERFSRIGEPCYRCVECDITFHFSCVPIQQSIKHQQHLHTLTLVDSFLEGGYHCDICETVRLPERHAYCCKECKFAAHIECVLSKEVSPKILSCLSPAAAYIEPPPSQNNKIRHMSHRHELSLVTATTETARRLNCEMCHLEICDHLAYTCSQQCGIWMHKRCIDLPQEVSHPLHPHLPLTLLKLHSSFVCRLCRDLSDTFRFVCRVGCDFVIDVKCAFETADTFSDRYSGFKTELEHPVYKRLILVKPTQQKYASKLCAVCNGEISGLRYCCSDQSNFFHHSCVQLPCKVEEHPLHPKHSLHLKKLYYEKCRACGYKIRRFGYRCRGSKGFCLHVECAFRISRFLKHKIHHHSLYYFHKHPSPQICINSYYSDPPSLHICSVCHTETELSYYRCVKCELNVHLECLRFPRIAKHKWHMHPLVYKDSIGFGGFYCDICEEERNVEHPVYCCESCKLVAHFDCIVSEENACNVVIQEIEGENLEMIQIEIEKKETSDDSRDSDDEPECDSLSSGEEDGGDGEDEPECDSLSSGEEDGGDGEDEPECDSLSSGEEDGSDGEDEPECDSLSSGEEDGSDGEDEPESDLSSSGEH